MLSTESRKIKDSEVEKIFNTYPKNIRVRLLGIRDLIFQVAEETDAVGDIIETLKWETPSYMPHSPKSGTTIRLSPLRDQPDKFTVSVHCQTNLISEFKAQYKKLEYQGNRSIIFDVNQSSPIEAIKHFIYLALTYHCRKDSRNECV